MTRMYHKDRAQRDMAKLNRVPVAQVVSPRPLCNPIIYLYFSKSENLNRNLPATHTLTSGKRKTLTGVLPSSKT